MSQIVVRLLLETNSLYYDTPVRSVPSRLLIPNTSRGALTQINLKFLRRVPSNFQHYIIQPVLLPIFDRCVQACQHPRVVRRNTPLFHARSYLILCDLYVCDSPSQCLRENVCNLRLVS